MVSRHKQDGEKHLGNVFPHDHITEHKTQGQRAEASWPDDKPGMTELGGSLDAPSQAQFLYLCYFVWHKSTVSHLFSIHLMYDSSFLLSIF